MAFRGFEVSVLCIDCSAINVLEFGNVLRQEKSSKNMFIGLTGKFTNIGVLLYDLFQV